MFSLNWSIILYPPRITMPARNITYRQNSSVEKPFRSILYFSSARRFKGQFGSNEASARSKDFSSLAILACMSPFFSEESDKMLSLNWMWPLIRQKYVLDTLKNFVAIRFAGNPEYVGSTTALVSSIRCLRGLTICWLCPVSSPSGSLPWFGDMSARAFLDCAGRCTCHRKF